MLEVTSRDRLHNEENSWTQSTDILDDIKKSSFELEQDAKNQTHLLGTSKMKLGGWEDQFTRRNFFNF
jgi:hypothetical protein